MALSSIALLGREVVEKSLYPVHALVDALETAFGNFSKGEDGGVNQPVRSCVDVAAHSAFLAVMPAYSSKDEALATKVITIYPENKTLPSHQGAILYFDVNNGKLKALIDAESVTEIRTAAASAVATKLLCSPNPRTLAIIGAGVQGKSHWDVFSQIFNFNEVRVYSRTRTSSEKLVSRIGGKGKVCDDVAEAVKDADVIVTATLSSKPVLMAEWVKRGAHINVVGAPRPHLQEVDPHLMRNSVVYVDSRAGAAEEAGDIILSNAEIYAEIGEVVNKKKEAKRSETTVFKSLGMALEDVIAAKLVYEKRPLNSQLAANL